MTRLEREVAANGGWLIAVDLDGTLAEWSDNQHINVIGRPIKPMVIRVRQWIKQGKQVVIFTARVATKGQRRLIRKWLKENNLPDLPITNKKDWRMKVFYDDRCVPVQRNKGVIRRTK